MIDAGHLREKIENAMVRGGSVTTPATSVHAQDDRSSILGFTGFELVSGVFGARRELGRKRYEVLGWISLSAKNDVVTDRLTIGGHPFLVNLARRLKKVLFLNRKLQCRRNTKLVQAGLRGDNNRRTKKYP